MNNRVGVTKNAIGVAIIFGLVSSFGKSQILVRE